MPDVQNSGAAREPLRNGYGSASKGALKKQLHFGLGLVLALGVGAAGIFLWNAQRSRNVADGTVETTLTLETFVVNLNGSSERAYLRVGVTIGMAHPLSRNQVDVPLAVLRDTILSVLAGAQSGELLKVEGKRQLKDELLKALQDRVPAMAIQNVYFTEFLVQM